MRYANDPASYSHHTNQCLSDWTNLREGGPASLRCTRWTRHHSMPNLQSLDAVLHNVPEGSGAMTSIGSVFGTSAAGEDGTEKARRPSRPSLQMGISTSVAMRVQVTPPETPKSPQEGSEPQPARALFHNYLRALHPFDPTASHLEGADASLMTASILPGDLILVHSIHANGWADGTVLTTGDRGWLPTNYCEAFDHPYLRNLLNAMTQFWDLLGGNENANLSAFVRQDYIRGLIAGVRYLLEHADCLHREARLVQRHSGIRRMRKGLLADLSSLVQIAKGLQETIGEPFASDIIHYILDDLIAKASKVVTRAVGFVDMWTKEVVESDYHAASHRDQPPATPPTEFVGLVIDTAATRQPGISQPVDSAKVLPTPTETYSSHDAVAGAEAETERRENLPTEVADVDESRRTSMTHRLSLVHGDIKTHDSLASMQLSKAHDLCISYIGAFIGHHLHSRPSSELVHTADRVVKGCKRMLSVVDEVYMHDPQRSQAIRTARNDFDRKVQELVTGTKDVFTFSDAEDGNAVMLPEQTSRLVGIGTSLIRANGDLVSRTRSLIEKTGDFELGRTPPSPSKSADNASDSPRHSRIEALQETRADYVARGTMSFEKRLSKRLLPPAPVFNIYTSVTQDITDAHTAEPTSATAVHATISATPLSADVLRTLPIESMRRRSAVRISQHGISGAALRSPRSYEMNVASPGRKGSLGVSVAGSTETHRSSVRNSGHTAVSEISTRATTPDHAKAPISPEPGLLDSFTSLSSMHSVVTEAPSEAETQLLQKTYASELTLNQYGQVTGGSLPALIEQLTTHDSAPDHHFVSAFYLTFRLFTTPRDLASALIARFDYIGDDRLIGMPVRLRIYNIFKGWLETYWNAEADRYALGDIRYFAVHRMKPHLPSAGDRLLELTRKVATTYQTGTVNGPLVSGVGKTSLSIAGQHGASISAPEPAITKSQLNALRAVSSNGLHCGIVDFEPVEMARQITLITSRTFCSIQPDELLTLDWTTKGTQKSPNVRNMCTINTDLAHIVGDTILAYDDAKKRALVIKHWTKVAAHCLELNNYDSVMAIMCSINSSVVQRLRRTWEVVSKKTKARLSELNAAVDISRNYASLRSRLESPVVPCIPFLGIYLTDLTMLEAGNAKVKPLLGAASSDGQSVTVINFDLYSRMAKVISHLQKFQVPYNLQAVPEMQSWMERHMSKMRVDNDEMVVNFHRRSLLVEPRQEDMRPPTLPGADAVGDVGPRPKTANKERLETFLRTNTLI